LAAGAQPGSCGRCQFCRHRVLGAGGLTAQPDLHDHPLAPGCGLLDLALFG
jgi:hypothetical protein